MELFIFLILFCLAIVVFVLCRVRKILFTIMEMLKGIYNGNFSKQSNIDRKQLVQLVDSDSQSNPG